MKASELINLYNAGRRDFSGECLRGQNFAGKDLSGANFSGCDIRGANFTGATLREANFSQATAGLQQQWMMGLLLAVLLLIALSSIFFAFIGFLVALIFDSSTVDDQVIGWVSLGVLLIFGMISYWKGLGGGLGIGSLVGSVAGALAGAVPVAIAGAGAEVKSVAGAEVKSVAGAVAGVGAVAVTGAVAGVGVVAIAVAVAIAEVVAEVLAVAGAEVLAIAVAIAVAVAGAVAGAVAQAVAQAVAGVGAVAIALFASFIAYRAIKGDPRDAWIRTFAVAFAATGGTTFRKAKLIDANFSQARLKSTDFREAILTPWQKLGQN